MRARFRVEWTEAAAADLADIIRFIARASPFNAARLYKRIRKRADALRTFPNRGHIVPEMAELDVTSYRELSVSPYRILYRIDKSKVLVQAVLDERRDLRQLLAERLLRAG